MTRKYFPIKRRRKQKQKEHRALPAGITIPEVNICGARELDTALVRYEPDLLISICGEPKERKSVDFVIDLHEPLAYRMDFDDIHGPSGTPGGQAIKPGMIRNLFNFIDLNFPDSSPGRILAQCSMGISRSSAVVLLAGAHIAHRHACSENGAPDEALIARALVSRLRAAHPYMEPNRRVLDMGCRLMGEEMGEVLMSTIVKECESTRSAKGRFRKMPSP